MNCSDRIEEREDRLVVGQRCLVLFTLRLCTVPFLESQQPNYPELWEQT